MAGSAAGRHRRGGTARRTRLGALAGLALLAGCAAEAPPRFNWDALGATFCRAAVAEDASGLAPILTPSLRRLIEDAARQGPLSPRMLFSAYDAPAAGCMASTRNAALVEVRREGPGGLGWTDVLVVVPEADGSTRIDDILFATRRSDTLRQRLQPPAPVRGATSVTP